MAKRIDFETIKDPIQLIKLLNAIDSEIDSIRSLINELRPDHGSVKSALNVFGGDGLITCPGLGIGTTPANVANQAFTYIINGQLYFKAAVAAGTAPGNDEIAATKYGAVAFDIGADGTIDAIEATNQAAAQFASAALAVAALPAVAADHVRMGYVTVVKADGAFTFGATSLDDAPTTEVYTNAAGIFSAVNALVPATLSAAAVTEQVKKSL